MSIKKTLINFFVLYLILELLAIIINLQTGEKTLDNTIILMLNIIINCGLFIKYNKRYFSKEEKSKLIIWFIVIDFILQLTGLIILEIKTDIMFSIFFVLIIHSIIIFFLVGFTKNIFKKYYDRKTIEKNETKLQKL